MAYMYLTPTSSQLKSEDREDEEETEAGARGGDGIGRGHDGGQTSSQDRLTESERSRCFEAIAESVEAIAGARGGGNGGGGGSRGGVSSYRQLLKAIEGLMGKKVTF